MALAGASAAGAEDVVVLGVDGRQGAVGVGDQDGSPGGDGETVLLEVESPDASNRAAVIAGDGGHGGGTEAMDGTSGRGGDGGDATAIATTHIDSGVARAIADARGGGGGSGGAVYSGKGVIGPGGTAGNSRATAVAINANGSASAEAWSYGGASAGGHDGGSATGSVTARGTSAASGRVSVFGGDGGSGGSIGDVVGPPAGDGASVAIDDSVATLSASDADADYRLDVYAAGGDGGYAPTGLAGDGGDAEIHVSRSGQSGSAYHMSLEANGGGAGDAGAWDSITDAFGQAGGSDVSGSLSFAGDATLEVSSQGGLVEGFPESTPMRSSFRSAATGGRHPGRPTSSR